jgi:hypothetical protein
MINDDNINELNDLFDDNESKVENTVENKVEEPAKKEEHPLGENDWVERRQNPHGRRKEDRDRLLATKILLFMVIVMIVITAGILGIELELKKEIDESIKSYSYDSAIQDFETTQKRINNHEEAKKAENEMSEENTEKEVTENKEETENKVEEATENKVEE